MTTEDRYVVDLGDILRVTMECVTCGASVSLNPKKWQTLPFSCPGCQITWHAGDSEQGYKTTDAFRQMLKSSIALAESKQLGYRVRLEVERPKG